MAASFPHADIPVVILAGGLGTRLREETDRVPKPMVQVGERPIMWHIMKLYSHFGHRRFIVCVGYKGWLIKQFFLHYRSFAADFRMRLSDEHEPVFLNNAGDEDWEVTCAETGLNSGTGARLRMVRDYIDTDTFLFTYGDGIGEVDIDRLLEFHFSQGRIGTVTGVRPTSRFGEIRVEGEKAVEFNEKPTLHEGFVSGGFFVFQREFFDYLTDEPDLFLERDPLQKLARDGQLSVFPHEGFWMGMDTFRDLTELNSLWESGAAPWKLWD